MFDSAVLTFQEGQEKAIWEPPDHLGLAQNQQTEDQISDCLKHLSSCASKLHPLK